MKQRALSLLMLLCCFLSPLAAHAETAPIPWDMEALSKAPQTWDAPGFEEWGMRALFYEGLPFEGRPTRVFAWCGLPKGAKAGDKVPGMVLIHGGGGTAFSEWVRLWLSRGYAAIAMDTCGCVPRGEYGKWERHDFGGPAGWGDFEGIDKPRGDQWPFHAVADAILAHSLLRSMPEVDPARIGVTGISWGGYLTCITAGVDSRFRFAVPVYGCGFLGENSAWLDAFKGMGAEKSGRWLGLWDPSVYLPGAAMPMLWVTGTNDFAYPMDSLQKSYRLAKGPRTLCVRVRMPHAHGGAGENPEEIHAFANALTRAKTALPKITGQGVENGKAWAAYESEGPVTGASLQFTRDAGKWQDRNWETLPAALNSDGKRAEAAVPEGATVWYLNLSTPDGLIVSTEHDEAPH